VVAHERMPALRRHALARSSIEVRGHVLAYGARRDLQSEFELQFIGGKVFQTCGSAIFSQKNTLVD